MLKKGAPCSLAWGKRMSASFNHVISVLCHKHTPTLPRNNDKLELHRYFNDGYRSCTPSRMGGHGKTSGLLFERIISCREKLHSLQVGTPGSCQGL